MAASNTPRPGLPVRGSDTGRPIMAVFDLLGRRWTLRIVGELGERTHGFNELQRSIGSVSPSVLTTRLRELRSAGLVDTNESQRYLLTPLGRSLLDALAPLWMWSDTWAETVGGQRNAPPPAYLREAHGERTPTPPRS